MVDAVEKRIVVVDVPGTATTEQAEHLLNAAFAQGYYVLAIHPGEDGGARAFFNKRTRTEPSEIPKPRRNIDGREADALGIIRNNPTASISELIGMFKTAGFARGRNWVSERRREIQRGA